MTFTHNKKLCEKKRKTVLHTKNEIFCKIMLTFIKNYG